MWAPAGPPRARLVAAAAASRARVPRPTPAGRGLATNPNSKRHATPAPPPPRAAEVLALYARLRGAPEGAVAGEVARLLARLGLGPIAARAAGAYSGGNRRRLSVGAALVGRPRVALLDEPSTGMVRAGCGATRGARRPR